MTFPRIVVAVVLILVVNGASADCAGLARIALPNASITHAERVEAGALNLPAINNGLARELPVFCRVAATLRPSPQSNIKIEVWLPEEWNGRLQSVGNGGLAGSISYAAMAAAVKERYATASTDTGHTGTAVSGEWALNAPEKILDFAHRAVHEMTLVAKTLIKSFYGRAQRYAYWNGCSEGGNQGLHEAQRYPQDYDGVIAGAPANFMTHLQAGGMWISHAIHKDPATFISAAKLPAINRAVLAACDDIDGLQDGIVEDPRACAFNIEALRCRGAETDACLTVAQLNGLMKVYAGAKDPHSSAQIFPGYMPGSELEWGTWIVGTDAPPKNRQHQIAESFFKFLVFHDPTWNWTRFHFTRDVEAADRIAGITNSINPDLSAFKQRGGKLLQYHGWYDSAISPLNSIHYFESAQKRMGATRDFYRLFMLPGVAHCGGGPGASEFDRMSTLQRWVEEGVAPEAIVATKTVGDAKRTRLLCPYPQAARYQGDSPDDAKNFECVSR